METILLVDGYNVINNWPEFETYKFVNLDAARFKLIETLGEFSPFPWHSIIIVFDAYKVKGGQETKEKIGGVTVVFTGEGDTADTFIERNVPALAKKYNVEVASSDALQQQIILGGGGQRLPVRELRNRILFLKKQLQHDFIDKLVDGRNPLDAYLHKQLRETLNKWRKQ